MCRNGSIPLHHLIRVRYYTITLQDLELIHIAIVWLKSGTTLIRQNWNQIVRELVTWRELWGGIKEKPHECL